MHPSLKGLSSREIEKVLLKNGFELERQSGSHKTFFGFVKGQKRRVTIVASQSDFDRKTLISMICQSGLSEQEWLKALGKK